MKDAAGPGGGLEPSLEISFGREVCGRLEEAERREWWLADGLGGYAAGTVAGTLTRRYHGLLIARPTRPWAGASWNPWACTWRMQASVSEIFDGDPPREPRACPAQAWSVACTLEAWWKLERAKPKMQRRGEEPS